MIKTVEDFEKLWIQESAITLSALKALTDDSLSQSIVDGHRTIGRIIWHIVTTIPEMTERIGLKLEGPSANSPVPDNVEEIKNGYLQVSKSLLEIIKSKWTDEMFDLEDDMYGEKWKRGFTFQVLILHQVHHRAQMTVLMRQAGLQVPNLYGPSKEAWSSMGMKEPEV